MYTYAIVEETLAKFFDIEANRRISFRGRLRNLQKLGLAPAAPGSGRRVQYTIFDICDLSLAMSLAEFGADPSEIVQDVKSGTFKEKYAGLLKMKRPMCVYIPFLFSGMRSIVKFMDFKDATKFVNRMPRAAVVDLRHILNFLETELYTIKAISPFQEQVDGSP